MANRKMSRGPSGNSSYTAQTHYMSVPRRVIRLRTHAMSTCLIRLGSKISKCVAPTLHAMEPRFSSIRLSMNMSLGQLLV